jgi:hypothetical protein
MWQVSRKHIDAGLFKPLQPVEILYDFEGPRTFTHNDSAGELCLAHWCDADKEINRFIIVPFTGNLVYKLKTGEITLREALNQPRVWVLDLTHRGDIREAWSVNLADLPGDVLPKARTMLWRSLERASKNGTAGLIADNAQTVPAKGDSNFIAQSAYLDHLLTKKSLKRREWKGSTSWSNSRVKPNGAAVRFKLSYFGPTKIMFGIRYEFVLESGFSPQEIDCPEIFTVVPASAKFVGFRVKNNKQDSDRIAKVVARFR